MSTCKPVGKINEKSQLSGAPRALRSFGLSGLFLAAVLSAGVLSVSLSSGCGSGKKGAARPLAKPGPQPGAEEGLRVPFSDSGEFVLKVKGSPLARVSFQWREDGSYESKRTLSMAGKTRTTTMKVQVDDQGRWETISVDKPRGEMKVKRTPSGAALVYRGRTTTVDWSEGGAGAKSGREREGKGEGKRKGRGKKAGEEKRAEKAGGETEEVAHKSSEPVLYEAFAPALIRGILHAYEVKRGRDASAKAKGKKRKVRVFFFSKVKPVEVGLLGEEVFTPKSGRGSKEARREKETSSSRAQPSATALPSVKVRRYVVDLLGTEVIVMAGARSRVLSVAVPSRYALWYRKGYEALGKRAMRRGGEGPGPISKPVHEIVVQKNVQVPMRDGVKLATDIYRPKKKGKYPVILVRTPYKKDLAEINGRFYAARGYAFDVQECRGRF